MSKKDATPVDPDKQKETIRALDEADEMRAGDTYYIVSARWYRGWKRFVGWEDGECAEYANEEKEDLIETDGDSDDPSTPSSNGSVSSAESGASPSRYKKPEAINNWPIVDAIEVTSRVLGMPSDKVRDRETGETRPSFVCLKKEIEESKDYKCIPKTVWEKLVSWYGGGGPSIPRVVIEDGPSKYLRQIGRAHV